MKKVRLSITLLLATLAALSLSACNDQQDIAHMQPDTARSAAQIWSDYHNNEVAADQQYKGRVVEITGRVGEISKDFTGNANISFQTQNMFESVHCTLDVSQRSAAAGIRKHSTQTLKCLGKGMVIGSPMFDHCIII
ncbi:OB-fold protein [Dongshaea marina]|uniref:OB-fold protein n=1 Tax=Dongshaea marina TaxID=2047966 RepID=UPI000D3EB458|nr:hypothetical protein [Dongshaea marina]